MAIRRTYGNAQQHLSAQNKRIDYLSKQLIKPIRLQLKNEYIAIANSQLGRGNYSSVEGNKRLEATLNNGLLLVGTGMAKDTQRLIRTATGSKKRNDIDDIETQISYLMTGYIGKKVKSISAATFNQVRGLIGNLRLDGSTIDDMIKAIVDYAEGVSLYRAHVIVRTEASAAAHIGQLYAAEASEFDTGREWISTNDDRIRTYEGGEFDHASADGQTATGFESFDVSGEQLLHPCDPNGSAGNIINCRCGTGVIIL